MQTETENAQGVEGSGGLLLEEFGRSMRTLKAFVVEDSPIIRDSLVSALQESAPAKSCF